MCVYFLDSICPLDVENINQTSLDWHNHKNQPHIQFLHNVPYGNLENM